MFRFLFKKMNGVFAIEKPSGISSLKFLGELQHIFTSSEAFRNDLNEARNKTIAALSTDKKWSKERIIKKAKNLKVKMGHGGTLDPLASGVLVIGVGTGTKQLQHYLGECDKAYETKALLGVSTTTADSEGEILRRTSVTHITKDMVLSAAQMFVGDLEQTPPIFSALKMNGKPLYDYAREGKPLPMPIKLRKVRVNEIKVFEDDLLSQEHEFESIKSALDDEGNTIESKLASNPTLDEAPLYFSDQYNKKAEEEGLPKEVGNPVLLSDGETHPAKLPLVHFYASVSSGTYIRSLVSDLGRALKSSAYMVELKRSKQKNWVLGKNVFQMSDFAERDERIWSVVLKKVLVEGPSVNVEHELNEVTRRLEPVLKKERSLLETEKPSSEEVDISSGKHANEELSENKSTNEASKKRKID